MDYIYYIQNGGFFILAKQGCFTHFFSTMNGGNMQTEEFGAK